MCRTAFLLILVQVFCARKYTKLLTDWNVYMFSYLLNISCPAPDTELLADDLTHKQCYVCCSWQVMMIMMMILLLMLLKFFFVSFCASQFGFCHCLHVRPRLTCLLLVMTLQVSFFSFFFLSYSLIPSLYQLSLLLTLTTFCVWHYAWRHRLSVKTQTSWLDQRLTCVSVG